ncbi:23283_t:CDS:2, partial [Racocetra persica]
DNMFAKTKKAAVKSRPKVIKPQLHPKSTSLTITETLKNKVFPHIVNDFADALKSLKPGENIRFGKLGVFKKTKRIVQGRMPILKKRGRPRKTAIATSALKEKPTNGHLSLRE